MKAIRPGQSLRATRFPPHAIEEDDQAASSWESAWQTWWERHAIRSASDGGLFPDVLLRRIRDRVEVSWGHTRTAGMPEHFDFAESDSGFGRLPPEAVAVPLHNVLAGASEYLLSLAPGSDRLKALGVRVARLRGLERHRDRRLMWLAGLGTDEHTIHNGWRRVKRYLSGCAEGPRRAMLETSESSLVVTGSCQASLMFGSLSPNVRKRDVLELARAIVELYVPGGDQQPIDDVCDAAPLRKSGDPPWYEGYELAESVHERIGTASPDDGFVDIEDVLRNWASMWLIGISLMRPSAVSRCTERTTDPEYSSTPATAPTPNQSVAGSPWLMSFATCWSTGMLVRSWRSPADPGRHVTSSGGRTRSLRCS